VCSENPEITTLIDYEAFCGTPLHDHSEGAAGENWDITPKELADRLKQEIGLKIIDIREPHELAISQINGAALIPLGQLAAQMSELDSADEIVLICRTGSRSTRALEILHNAGFRKIKNLKGGINAWAKDVDPSLPIY